jgi:uncharacterized protein YxjI
VRKALISPLRDTYGVQIDPSADGSLILAATVAIDQVSHD